MKPSTDPIFVIHGLSIQYGRHQAVTDLSLQLIRGRSLGLLGANGAGKTSTIRSLLGMVKPTQGKVSIFGESPGSLGVFKRLGYAPEDGVPAEYLTGQEYLGFVGSFRIREAKRRVKESRELLEWFELDSKKKIKDYSKGMKRRLLLAQALLGNPEFLILDEPLNGLDPLIIIRLRERLEAYCTAGGTLLFSSHILAEVEKTCTDVAILSKGVLACSAPVSDLVKQFGSVESAFASKVSGT